MTRRLTLAFFTAIFLLSLATASVAQDGLKLLPMKNSKVKLVSGKHSVTVDLDEALAGTNGTMPGEAPHTYRVLFTTQKDGFLYLVANVQSRSPTSDPMAPCGGDSPQSILWIKADKTLKTRVVDSQIYASCSYNFYDSKLKVTKTGLTAHYGGRELHTMKYDNREPEKGLIITSMLEPPDR